jgi:hypothetical protein
MSVGNIFGWCGMGETALPVSAACLGRGISILVLAMVVDGKAPLKPRLDFSAVAARLKPPQRRGPVSFPYERRPVRGGPLSPGTPESRALKRNKKGESPIVDLCGLPPIEQKAARYTGHPVSSPVGRRSRWTTDTKPYSLGAFLQPVEAKVLYVRFRHD